MTLSIDRSDLQAIAQRALELAEARDIQIATAESCTGGQIASLLTGITSLGRFFDRGFVAYTDDAKTDQLGIPATAIARHGAVSEQIAKMMAKGALERSKAHIAIGVTGYAGPAGAHDEAGLVYLATIDRSGACAVRECRFGNAERDRVKDLATRAALEMLGEGIAASREVVS